MNPLALVLSGNPIIDGEADVDARRTMLRAEGVFDRVLFPAVVATLAGLIVIGSWLWANEPHAAKLGLWLPLVIWAFAAFIVFASWIVHDRRQGKRLSDDTQDQALSRIAAVLERLDGSAKHEVFNRVRLDIQTQDGQAEIQRNSMNVEVFVGSIPMLAPRITVLVGEPGAGKTTLLLRLGMSVARENLAGRGSSWPIYLSAQTWSRQEHVSKWVEIELGQSFGISRRISSSWLHSTHAILMVDGLEELETEAEQVSLLSALSDWGHLPSKGKIVITARESELPLLRSSIGVERTVRIQPLRSTTANAALSRILRESSVFGSLLSERRMNEQLRVLKDIVAGHGVTPSFIRALEVGSSSGVIETSDDSEIDRWTSQLDEADHLLYSDKRVPEALEVYARLSRLARPELARQAAMRAALALASIGESERARTEFDRALKLFEDLNPLVHRPQYSGALTGDQAIVFKALHRSRPLLFEEIQDRCRIAPSAAHRALEELMHQGFVTETDAGSARILLYQSTVDWDGTNPE